MVDFSSTIAQQPDLSDARQKKITQASGTDMDSEHKAFVSLIIAMIDTKQIDPLQPESLLKHENYGKLSEQDRGAVDFALATINDQLRQVELFYRDRKTPNASPELQNMIEHLWQMKSRVEEKHGDVFKF